MPKHAFFACRQSFGVRKPCLRLYGNKAEAWLQQSISVLDTEACVLCLPKHRFPDAACRSTVLPSSALYFPVLLPCILPSSRIMSRSRILSRICKLMYFEPHPLFSILSLPCILPAYEVCQRANMQASAF